MSGREFDKAIQEKAQQLRLDPSPEVWERVSANLDRRRKRRAVAWFFSAAAIISGIVVGGYWNSHQGQPDTLRNKVTSSGTGPITQPGIQPVTSTAPLTKNSTASDQNFTQQEKIAAKSVHTTSSTAAYQRHKSSHNKKSVQVLKKVGSSEFSEDPIISNNMEGIVQTREIGPALVGKPQNQEEEPIIKANRKSLSDRLTAMQKKDSDKKPDEQPLWSGDLYFAAGISPMVSLQAPKEALSGSASLSLINNPTASVSLPGKSSAVRPAGAYQLGINISRKITQRLTAVSGIRYAYFANQISVGETVNTAVPVYNDRMERLNATAIYTGNGHKVDYTNQYHFLQLPLELGVGLGRKRRINLQSGLVLGYLVHTNALLYNQVSGVYYSDNDAIRKWQAGVSSRVNYRILNSTQFNIDLGPFVQYQLSPLYAAPKGQHLLAAGLSGRILLKK